VNWCSSGGSCPAQTNYISLTVDQGYKNPPNARFPSNSIKIETYTSAGDKIDAIFTNLITIPQCNYGALQSVSLARSVHVVGQKTKLTFTFKTTAGSAGNLVSGQGYVNIMFPAGFLFTKGSVSPTCTVKDATSAVASAGCEPSYSVDSLG